MSGPPLLSRWHRLCLATPNPTKYPSPLAIKQCWVKGTSDLSFLLSLFLSLPNQAESPKAQQERLKKKAGATTATLKDDLSQPNSDHTQPKNRLRTSAQNPPNPRPEGHFSFPRYWGNRFKRGFRHGNCPNAQIQNRVFEPNHQLAARQNSDSTPK